MIHLRRLIALVLVVLLNACASLPPQTGRTETHAVQDTAGTRLGAAFAPGEAAHPGSNAFHLLPNAMDALVARIILTEAADRTLDMQYYIWHDDATGRTLAAAMLRAADRGVRVRLLLDDLGTNADDEVLLALASHPNVQVRLFNPVASRRFKTLGSALEFFRVNRRMHNKSLIADNQGAILGGRNIGDEYFGASTHGRVRRSRRARARAGGARGVERLRSILELAGRLSDREPDRPSRRPRRARGLPGQARRVPRVRADHAVFHAGARAPDRRAADPRRPVLLGQGDAALRRSIEDHACADRCRRASHVAVQGAGSSARTRDAGRLAVFRAAEGRRRLAERD